MEHLTGRVGAGAAANHHRHAVAAGDALTNLIQSDTAELGQSPDQFQFFLAFSYEVFDGINAEPPSCRAREGFSGLSRRPGATAMEKALREAAKSGTLNRDSHG